MTDRHQFRAHWHNYDVGLFFVTICCKEKRHYFGEIYNTEMIKTEAGNITEKHISTLPSHFSCLNILKYVIMPNHIHLLIQLTTESDLYESTYSEKTISLKGCLKPKHHEAPAYQDFHHNSQLSVIIRSLKGGISRECNANGIDFHWQSRFHEHIVRNQQSYNNISNYIDKNIEHWQYDRFNINHLDLSKAPWNKNTNQ